jgi:predicted nucleic-acid-binding protein
MKYLIDTNIFLRILIPENEKSFLECTSLIKEVKNGSVKAMITNVTLAELAWTLKSYYKIKKDKIVIALKSILDINGLVVIDKLNSTNAVELYEKYNVKFIDCLLASIIEIQNKTWTIISYDKDFDKLNIIRKEPREIG